MISYNGKLVSSEGSVFTIDNRAFKYGDAVFETLKIQNSKILFLEDHYFRLMASLRIFRMDVPMHFTLEFVEAEIVKLINSKKLQDARVRFTVFRKDGGLYRPVSNEIDFVIEASVLEVEVRERYEVDLFKDFYVYSGLLSSLKTTNRALNVISSIYARENNLDTCILINENKMLVEAIHGNIFVVKGNKVITPPISDGCVKGVVRNRLIDLIVNSSDFELEERSITPFEIKNADELFITNSIIDIQPVTNYRKKIFKTEISSIIRERLKKEY